MKFGDEILHALQQVGGSKFATLAPILSESILHQMLGRSLLARIQTLPLGWTELQQILAAAWTVFQHTVLKAAKVDKGTRRRVEEVSGEPIFWVLTVDREIPHETG